MPVKNRIYYWILLTFIEFHVIFQTFICVWATMIIVPHLPNAHSNTRVLRTRTYTHTCLELESRKERRLYRSVCVCSVYECEPLTLFDPIGSRIFLSPFLFQIVIAKYFVFIYGWFTVRRNSIKMWHFFRSFYLISVISFCLMLFMGSGSNFPKILNPFSFSCFVNLQRKLVA